MEQAKRDKCNEVLGLMQDYEVSIKDLSSILGEFSLDGGLTEVQQKIKGFLYADPKIIEPDK